jgi:hypothetical protein
VLEVRQHLNGPKKYCVPGREPDTADSLENDGLIKQKGKNIVVLLNLTICALSRGSSVPTNTAAHTGCRYPFPISWTFRSRKVTKGTGRCVTAHRFPVLDCRGIGRLHLSLLQQSTI